MSHNHTFQARCLLANLPLNSALIFYLAMTEDACVKLEGDVLVLELATMYILFSSIGVRGCEGVCVCVCMCVGGWGVLI